MTLKVDGTNGVLQAYDYQVLTTGFTYTFAAGTQTLIANPAGTLATGTVTMPASPVDGMVITVMSTQQVTAVTVAANTGQTIAGAPSQLIPNQPLSFMYNLANTKWQPFAGGAGRASSLVSGTTVASTSGTSIDFTGIPSWARRVTMIFTDVSANATASWIVQAGTSGSVVSSGYRSVTSYIAPSTACSASTAGMQITQATGASGSMTGHVVFTLQNASTNLWVCTSSISDYGAVQNMLGAGNVTLSGAIDRVRLTTTAGTATFDAGSINITYE